MSVLKIQNEPKNITVVDFLCNKLEGIEKLYNKIEYKENNDPIYFWNAYSKLIEALICLGNTHNLMQILRSYVTQDRNSPNMIHVLKTCLKYCPKNEKKNMFDTILKHCFWHQNYDEMFEVPLNELLENDKNGEFEILTKERELIYEKGLNPEDVLLKINFGIVGLYEKDEEVPFYWYTIVYYEDDIQEFIEVLEECLDNNDKLKLIKIWKDNFYKEKFVVYKKLKESNQFLFEKQTFKMISCFL